MLTILAQHAVDGIVLGAILALPALGLALIWRVQGFPHLAHGSLMTVAAYLAWAAATAWQLPLPIAIAVGLASAMALGVAMHLAVYRRLAGRPMLSLFIASVGLELFLRYGVVFVFGSDFQTFPLPAERGMRLGLVVVRPLDLLLAIVALAALAGVWWMFRGTQVGRRMRAIADNASLARVCGISPNQVLIAMWLLVSLLAGASGILLGIRDVISPTLGWDVLLLAFAAAILGGITNPFGAAIGAFLMGLVSQIGIIWLPGSYEEGIAFGLIAIVLMLRPRGLFGESVRA
ncbi:MAG TPA: branched-chain amino acid ABC transporter permease [Candidatus Dormibacteraeota bacterium]|nr:branched-chain amino acid ABC transporter permease [Candidatus Dormibacteraeota bacterium]